jgi:zinc carboxypeptidase
VIRFWSVILARPAWIPLRALAACALISACSAGVPGRAGTSGPQVFGSYPPRDLQSRRPQTRAERSGFTETSRYADVMAFIDSLKAANKYVHATTMGKSSQGKDIPLVILARPAVRTPAEAKRLNRPIVYIQGNIHGGEVEGKEALLSLLRDLAVDIYANVTDSIVIVAAPIYNIDGNEAFGPQEQNRSEQNGPALVGQRANGQGLDLNRDYIKAEAPETRASLELFRAWDPDVIVDLHTTDGSYHGYALTYAPPLNPAARFSGPFTRDTVLPAVRSILRQRERIETFPYGNFASQDSVERGWYTYDHRPRFGTNYYGLRGRVAVLSEAYSHDPFRKRIASTYSFVSELLSLIAANHEEFLEVGREADRRTTAFASTPNSSPAIAIRSRLTQTPRVEEMLIEDVVRVGDTTRYEAGLPRGARRTGKVRTARVPVYDRFEPTLRQQLPFAWVVPAEQKSLIEPLRSHGVFVEQADARTVIRAERFLVDSVIKSARPFQGHQEVRLVGRAETTDSLVVEAGSYIVRAAQPLGILALYLLDPQSDDGFVTWNLADAWLRGGGYHPVARVLDRMTIPLRPVRE